MLFTASPEFFRGKKRKGVKEFFQENESLAQELKESKGQSIVKRMQELQLHHVYEAAVALLERIPPEILDIYAGGGKRTKNITHERGNCL